MNCNTSSTNPNHNLVNPTYPPPHTFRPVLISRILPIATPASPHPRILQNVHMWGPARYKCGAGAADEEEAGEGL